MTLQPFLCGKTVILHIMDNLKAMCDNILLHGILFLANTAQCMTLPYWTQLYSKRHFHDGSFSSCDFPFEIGGEIFERLQLLVNGVDPTLECFVKPITVPIGDDEAMARIKVEGHRSFPFCILEKPYFSLTL